MGVDVRIPIIPYVRIFSQWHWSLYCLYGEEGYNSLVTKQREKDRRRGQRYINLAHCFAPLEDIIDTAPHAIYCYHAPSTLPTFSRNASMLFRIFVVYLCTDGSLVSKGAGGVRSPMFCARSLQGAEVNIIGVEIWLLHRYRS